MISYIKKNIDLAAAFVLALVTALFTKIGAGELVSFINFSLLALLFCLMAIVAGLRKFGFFTRVFSLLFREHMRSRSLSRFFIFICFFTSMAFTNDVSLIIFVPLAISIFKDARALRLVIPVVTWQTIAANLGSMLTPIGNPQNLFIYSHYELGLLEFLRITAPMTALSGCLLYMASFTLKDRPIVLKSSLAAEMPKGRVAFLLFLFSLCLLEVLRVLPIGWLLAVVVPAIFLLDRKLFKDVDYKLLLLFLFLFVAVGNLTHIPGLADSPRAWLAGHEFWISLLLSQAISNVPATVMLSPYTENYTALLLGVNVGGLGTLIASMASLISFKAYISMRFHWTRHYLFLFTGANLLFLAALLSFYLLFY